MADDTRQNIQPLNAQPVKEDLSREALTVDPSQQAFKGKQWLEARSQTQRPGTEQVNMMAGGTMNTAGGKLPEVSMTSVFGSIRPEEFLEIHKKPCVRDALMLGIGAGFGVGGLRAILGGKVWACCNWAVLSFMGGSFGQYQLCQNRRRAEKEGMTRAMEIMNKKDIERKAREARKETVRNERRKVAEAEQESRFAAVNKAAAEKSEPSKSWKFW